MKKSHFIFSILCLVSVRAAADVLFEMRAETVAQINERQLQVVFTLPEETAGEAGETAEEKAPPGIVFEDDAVEQARKEPPVVTTLEGEEAYIQFVAAHAIAHLTERPIKEHEAEPEPRSAMIAVRLRVRGACHELQDHLSDAGTLSVWVSPAYELHWQRASLSMQRREAWQSLTESTAELCAGGPRVIEKSSE